MKRKAAFTLMELMIVTSIVVVLMALLFPAVNRATAGAKQAGCVSNLRQLGVGAASYAGDNQGDWPRYLPDDDAHGRSTAGGVWIVSEGPAHWESIGRVYPYINNKKFFFCPNNPGMRDEFFKLDWENLPSGGSQNVYGSYVLRGRLHTGNDPLGKKLGDIASRVYVSCGFMYLPGAKHIFPFSAHPYKYPVLFGDGHVAVSDLPSGIDPKNPPNMWSSPATQVQIWDHFDKAK